MPIIPRNVHNKRLALPINHFLGQRAWLNLLPDYLVRPASMILVHVHTEYADAFKQVFVNAFFINWIHWREHCSALKHTVSVAKQE